MQRTYDTLAEEQQRERHKAELASDLEITSSDEEAPPAAGVHHLFGCFHSTDNTSYILMKCRFMFCDWCADESWGRKRSKYYGADLDKRSDLYRCAPTFCTVETSFVALDLILLLTSLSSNDETKFDGADCFRPAR